MRIALAAFLSCSSTVLAPAQSPPCIESSLGADLQLSDDQVAQNLPLGFAFPYAGRTIHAVSVSSNGFLWLGSSADNGCCNGSLTSFLADPPGRIAAVWTDLNPSAGGSVHFATFPGRAVVTWNDVPEFGQGEPITAQVQLLADGSVLMGWEAPATIVSHTTLVGITPGGGVTNGRAVDFANGLPFDSGTSATIYELFPASTFDLGGRVIRFTPNGQGGFHVTRRTDCRFASFSTVGTGCPPALPVVLFASAASRPALGSTFEMIVGEAPDRTSVGAMLYGTATATPLTAIGMTSCTMYASGSVVVPFAVQGRYSVVGLPIPNVPGLVGASFAAQAMIVAPGANPAGVVASNGGTIEIGT